MPDQNTNIRLKLIQDAYNEFISELDTVHQDKFKAVIEAVAKLDAEELEKIKNSLKIYGTTNWAKPTA